MGFWRESVSWWIGPGHPWINRDRAEAATDILAYSALRRWPLVFRDADSFRTFCELLSRFANGAPVEIQHGGRSYDSVDSFLITPEKAMNHVLLSTRDEAGHDVRLQISNEPLSTAAPGAIGNTCFVYISGNEPQRRDHNETRFAAITEALEDYARPVTRYEKIRKRPVITKRTESEYYADSRARKVRRLSWLFGILGGLIAAFGTHFLGWT